MSWRTRAFCFPAAAFALAASSPRAALADEAPTRPEQHESDFKPPSSVRLPTIVGGLGLTAAFWGLGAGSSYVWKEPAGMTNLRAPIVGPWLALSHQACADDGCGVTDVARATWFVLDGLAQAGGLVVALEGLLIPTRSGVDAVPVTPRPSIRTREKAPPGSPAPADDAPATPPPAGPLFFIPRPITIGKGGVGVGVGGIFL
jgi:hypothetical protein